MVKDWGCIKKYFLGWFFGFVLNFCLLLFYVVVCFCVGGREKKNIGDLFLGFKLKFCFVDSWSGFLKVK